MKQIIIVLIVFLCPLTVALADDGATKSVENVIQVDAYEMPFSSLLSEETKSGILATVKSFNDWFASSQAACSSVFAVSTEEVAAVRQCEADQLYKMDMYKALRDKFPVNYEKKKIDGVLVEIFTPKGGVSENNKHRVLVNIHGGGFVMGARTMSHFESIPIASEGKIKVISIDYRMAPDFVYPAANDDIVAVYRQLLKTYDPEKIGMYGGSAGAALLAQSMPRFLDEGLPLPAAIALIAYGIPTTVDGFDALSIPTDSFYFAQAVDPAITIRNSRNPYFAGADLDDPKVAPGNYDEPMKQFPPTLIMSSIRDHFLSLSVRSHASLVRLGVEADLHVWEGLGHAAIYLNELPESREAYDVTIKFFGSHLSE